MLFNTERVYTALNADEVKIGSNGYFADTIERTFKKIAIFVVANPMGLQTYQESDFASFYQ